MLWHGKCHSIFIVYLLHLSSEIIYHIFNQDILHWALWSGYGKIIQGKEDIFLSAISLSYIELICSNKSVTYYVCDRLWQNKLEKLNVKPGRLLIGTTVCYYPLTTGQRGHKWKWTSLLPMARTSESAQVLCEKHP